VSRILAAIDSSLAARPVLATAAALAPVLGADVEALYVAEEESQTPRDCAASFGFPFCRLSGDPLRRITESAAADDVVAVAIGARGRPSKRRTGHLAREVADATDKPVLVVPPDAKPPARLHTVVIAMEGTPGKARSLRAAVAVAAGADLELVVVHVDDEDSIPSFSDQVAHETESYAQEFLSRYLHGAPKARLELRIGVPADEIIGVADSTMADLLAVGWPHSQDERRGAVARELLDRSQRPVLLVALDDL
jgi:nucleotide-binding universal stress UspA family protein